MTHVSLFSGIGGLDLAAEWAGFRTILQVEQNRYALRVLGRHWPGVPRIHDVREVDRSSVTEPVTVVSGGFPCQPFSAAGKRRGAEDDRYLWPQLLRIVEELRPAWIVGENVSGLLSIGGGMEIDRMLDALAARNYTPWILHYPAAGVGAYHKRDRVFIVAHAPCELPHRDGGERERRAEPADNGENVAHADQQGSQGYRGSDQCSHEWFTWAGSRPLEGIWESEPDVGRVAHGIPRRVDRLRALGNAVVPQQAFPIFRAIAETASAYPEAVCNALCEAR